MASRMIAALLALALGCAGKKDEPAAGGPPAGPRDAGVAVAAADAAPAAPDELEEVPTGEREASQLAAAYLVLAAASEGRCVTDQLGDHSDSVAVLDGQVLIGMTCGSMQTGRWMVGMLTVEGDQPRLLGARVLDVSQAMTRWLWASPTRWCVEHTTFEGDTTTMGLMFCVPAGGAAAVTIAPAEPPPPPTAELAPVELAPDQVAQAYAALAGESFGLCSETRDPAHAPYAASKDGNDLVVAMACGNVADRKHLVGLLRQHGGPLKVIHSLRETEVDKLTLGPLQASKASLCMRYGQGRDGKITETLCSRRR